MSPPPDPYEALICPDEVYLEDDRVCEGYDVILPAQGPVPPPPKPKPQGPWPLTASWPQDGGSYSDWIGRRYGDFNDSEYLCNWWPLKLLIEFAAESGLRVRLLRWKNGAKRPPDNTNIFAADQLEELDSHGSQKTYSSKDAFYAAAKSSVTARMLAQLNTVKVSPADAKKGDLISLDYGDDAEAWHSYLIVLKLTLFTQPISYQYETENGNMGSNDDGSEREKIPSKNHRTRSLPSSAYEGAPRRWNFALLEDGMAAVAGLVKAR